jgi:hypothetical protein
MVKGFSFVWNEKKRFLVMSSSLEMLIQGLDARGIHDFCAQFMEVEGSRSAEEIKFVAEKLGCPFEDDEDALRAWGRVFFSKSLTTFLYEVAEARDVNSRSKLEMMLGSETSMQEARDASEAETRYLRLIYNILPRRRKASKYKLADGTTVSLRALRRHVVSAASAEHRATGTVQGITDYLAFGQQSVDRVSLQTTTGAKRERRKGSRKRAQVVEADILRELRTEVSEPQETDGRVAQLNVDERQAAKMVLELKESGRALLSSRPPSSVSLDLSSRWTLYDNGIDFVSHARELGTKCVFVDLAGETEDGTSRLETIRATRVVSFPSDANPRQLICYDAHELLDWARKRLGLHSPSSDAEKAYAAASERLMLPGTDQPLRAGDLRRAQEWVEADSALERVLESVDERQRLAIETAAAHLMPTKTVDSESGWVKFLGRKLYNALTSKFSFGARQIVYGAEWLANWLPRILALSMFVSVVKALMCLTAKFYLFNTIAPGIGTTTFIGTELHNSLEWVLGQMGVDAARAVWDKLFSSSLTTSPSLTTSVVVSVLSWISEKIGMSAPVRALVAWRTRRGAGDQAKERTSRRISTVTIAVLAAAAAAAGGAVALGGGAGALCAFYQRATPEFGASIFGIFGTDRIKTWALDFGSQMPLIRGWNAVFEGRKPAEDVWSETEAAAARVAFVSELVSKYVCRLFSEGAERGCRRLFDGISRTSAAIFLVSSIADVLYNLGVLAVYGLARGHSFLRMPCLVGLSAMAARHELTRELGADEAASSLHAEPKDLGTEGGKLGELVEGGDAMQAELARGYEDADLVVPRMKHLERAAARIGGLTLSTTRADLIDAREKELDERTMRKLTNRDGNVFHADDLLDPSIPLEKKERLLEVYRRKTLDVGRAALAEAEEQLEQSKNALRDYETILKNLLATRVQRSDLDVDILQESLLQMAEREPETLREIAQGKTPSALGSIVRRFFFTDKINGYIRDVMQVSDSADRKSLARSIIELSEMKKFVGEEEARVSDARSRYETMKEEYESKRGEFESYQNLSDFWKRLERIKIKTSALTWRTVLTSMFPKD